MTQKPTPTPQRIQGTDGIRGKVKCTEELTKTEAALTPLQYFLEEGVLTEEFFELYTYTYCQELLYQGLASEQSCIVIGWDSRDTTGIFNQAAIQGICKAGLNAIVVGILPTPAIALYQIHKQAICSFVLTASHNPSDQNGIKIFLGSNALKLFPADDICFTQALLKQDFAQIKEKTPQTEPQHEEQRALQHFIDFSLSPFNLWKDSATFADTTLIIDAAYGACVPVIQELVKQITCKALFLENCNFSKEINLDSGVADLEGVSFILPEMLETGSGKFRNYSALHRIFQEGRSRKEALSSGKEHLLAWVFDGDGDRCFILCYDPFEDNILVCSGDPLAWWQGSYLKEQHSWESTPLFVNTVESDLELSRTAQCAGFESIQTAVGDKWILWQSFLQHWKALKSHYQKKSPAKKLCSAIENLDSAIESMQKKSSFDALSLTLLFQAVEKQVLLEKDSEAFGIDYKDFSECLKHLNFAIGSEPSGHAISLGLTANNSGKQLLVFIGNGIKSALNTCVVFQNLMMKKGHKDFYASLKTPFPNGFQQSKPVYYVDKSLLFPGNSFREALQNFMMDVVKKECPENTVELVFRPEEPEMLFLLLMEAKLPVAALFVRNSGTEDKLSLYVRSMLRKQEVIQKVFAQIYNFILPQVKNADSALAQAESRLIQQLTNTALPESELSSGLPPRDQRRLIHEMADRQGLISLQNNKWCLTALGEVLGEVLGESFR